MDYYEIYFAVASVSTIILAGFLMMILIYVLAIVRDIKKVSRIAKKEVEIIARGLEKGASMFGTQLSDEAAGFVKTIFALLLSHFAPKKSRTGRVSKTRIL
jgi:hypothetical protein